MEKHMTGAQVGPTAGCIIADQFIALKKGDRFWHENAGVFSDDQLEEVKSIGLAKVMCEVLDGMTKASENPFILGGVRVGSAMNGVQNCEKIGKINFSAWKERSVGPPTTTVAPIDDDTTTDPTPKPTVDTSTVDHTTIACRMVNGRRHGIVECGSSEQWTDDHLIALATRIEKTGAVRNLQTYRIFQHFRQNKTYL